MATKPRPNKPADELKLEIARSRDRVERDFRELRYELDIPGKIRRSFRQKPALWAGAALAVGTLIVLLPMRKKKVYVDLESGTKAKSKNKLLEAGFILGVLRIAATLLKPTIVNFVLKKIGGHTRPERSGAKW